MKLHKSAVISAFLGATALTSAAVAEDPKIDDLAEAMSARVDSHGEKNWTGRPDMTARQTNNAESGYSAP